MLKQFLDLLRVLRALPEVERGRISRGPSPLLKRLRRRSAPTRSAADRGRLRRAIGLVDRFCPGGPNCYRRVLLEVALDGGAALEPIHLGLMRGGGLRSGHAWIDPGEKVSAYDVQLSI